jgi:hypothetical protein
MCLALLFSGVANAALSKDDAKCVNSINKGAQQVAATQGKENSACVKNEGKGKLTTDVEVCLTADLGSKVSDKIGKIKTTDCLTPPAFPNLISTTNKQTIGDLMIDKELALIHAVFGSDLDLQEERAEGRQATAPGRRC